MKKGIIYLIPNTLGDDSIEKSTPIFAKKKISSIRFFIVESVKLARRYLKKIDRLFPIDECEFYELKKKNDTHNIYAFIDNNINGNDIGLISDAGCPCVADPGAQIVSIAHEKGIKIHPLVGPSSILLTLMGSGFSGQKFYFHGYLPKNRKNRIIEIQNYERDTRKNGTTHLFMDTPYRNMNVLDDLLNELSDKTYLCIASNINLAKESIKTMEIKEWRKNAYDLNKKPTMFAIGRIQSFI